MSIKNLVFIFMLLANLECMAVESEAPSDKSDSKPTQSSLLNDSQELLAKINQMSKQTFVLKKQFKNIPIADQLMFVNLVTSLETEARKNLDQLISIQQQLDQFSPETQVLKKKIQTIIRSQAVVVQDEIELLKKIFATLREMDQKKQTTQFAVQRAKQEIFNLLDVWLQNIERKKQLGMNVDDSTQKLTQNVQLLAMAQTSRIRLYLDTIKQLNSRIEDVDESEQKEITSTLRQLEWQKDIEANNLEQMIVILNKLDVDTTKFGQALVIATGKILNENVETEAVRGLFQQLFNKAMFWLNDNLPLIIFRIILFVFTIFVFRIIAAIVRRLVNRATATTTTDSSQLLHNFLGSIIHKIIMLVGIIIALSQLGIEIGPLLAGMGIMGFVVGFALQDSLSNFASGLMILIYRPFDIGDFVDVASISGEVKQMNLVSTTVLTGDRKRMIIPNTKIWGNIITNVTAEDIRRIDFVFNVGYKDNLDTAEQILRTIIQNHELVLPDPPTTIKLHTLAESSIEFIARPWVKRQNYWEVYWDVTRKVKDGFDQAGLSMPYPQLDVHHVRDNENTQE